MDILRQCQASHEKDEFQKTVDPPKAMPKEEPTPKRDGECKKEISVGNSENGDGADSSRHDPKGSFCGFVLLSKAKWDNQQFIRDMKEEWDITVKESSEGGKKNRDDPVIFEVDGMTAIVSLMSYPVPNGEAEINAKNNYMWRDAVKAAEKHRAHIMAAVMGKDENLLEQGKLFTKITAACCRQKYATGVYTSGVVFQPKFYEGAARIMKEGEIPLLNWIWFGLYRGDRGMNAYTYGMDVFGKTEMEVLNANAEPDELMDFLADIAAYVLKNDVELQDGETIGFSAEDKHAITRSKGVSLPEDQMTLKISFEQLEEGLNG